MPAGVTRPSKDGTVIGFVLRKGVSFRNGDPFTAEDVRFSFQRYKGASAKLLKERVREIEGVNPHRAELGVGEGDEPPVGATSGGGRERGTLADPQDEVVDIRAPRVDRRHLGLTEDVDVHEQAIEEGVEAAIAHAVRLRARSSAPSEAYRSFRSNPKNSQILAAASVGVARLVSIESPESGNFGYSNAPTRLSSRNVSSDRSSRERPSRCAPGK
jgi:hypothetical protein